MQDHLNGAMSELPMVLVVDDSADIVALIGTLLRTHCRTKAASNGEEGIAAALADPVPDLILLDVMMPGISGIEACRRLKAEARTRDVPVIFLTALAERSD